jgi:hypothetical protein
MIVLHFTAHSYASAYDILFFFFNNNNILFKCLLQPAS